MQWNLCLGLYQDLRGTDRYVVFHCWVRDGTMGLEGQPLSLQREGDSILKRDCVLRDLGTQFQVILNSLGSSQDYGAKELEQWRQKSSSWRVF